MFLDQLYIQPLDRDYHHIDTFHCGKSILDELLHAPDRLEGCGRTYVVVSERSGNDILACFTLLPDPQDILAEDEVAVEFNAVLLNILAVNGHCQKQGIGRWILLQLMLNMVQIAETHPLDYLLVEPLDDEALSYYQHINLGFEALGDSGRLALSLETMRQAVAGLPYEYGKDTIWSAEHTHPSRRLKDSH